MMYALCNNLNKNNPSGFFLLCSGDGSKIFKKLKDFLFIVRCQQTPSEYIETNSNEQLLTSALK